MTSGGLHDFLYLTWRRRPPAEHVLDTITVVGILKTHIHIALPYVGRIQRVVPWNAGDLLLDNV